MRKFAALLVLVPCWWQPHVVAGDLASHLYNAWVASLVRDGRAPGLTVVPQFTNIVFDLMLSGFYRLFGMWAAEHLAVTVAAAVFVSGAMAFISAAAGRVQWHTLPVVAVLAYGWVFHIGFFNFYIGLGLSLWALALLWTPSPRRVALAAAALAGALAAHALPVGWAAGVLAFRLLAPRVGPARLAIAAVAALTVARVVAGSVTLAWWFPSQVWRTTGLDQLWVYDAKYAAPLALLAAVWTLWAIAKRRSSGKGRPEDGSLGFICAITSAGIFILPTVLKLPGYAHQIAYISDRMSLALAVCVCAWLAPAVAAKWDRRLTAALAVVFLGFLLRDQMVLNRTEADMARAVERIPIGQRVIAPIAAPVLRADPLPHMLDRICIGRCFSYGNYEPATAQFRVRVAGQSPIVVSNIEDAARIQLGIYTVKPGDVPLFGLTIGADGRFLAGAMPAGGRLPAAQWSGL